jgi:aromatic-amino-acid transaminase
VKEHFLQNLINLNKNVKVYLTYSCSKTFSLYGLRLGVLFFLSKQKKESLVLSKYVRGVYSNPPTLPISIINKLFSNPKYYDSYISQLEEQRKILQERSEIFINEANKIKLQFCEYLGGFFIFIPCKNSFSAYEKLKKENIFIAPLDTGVRISIGYVSKKEIKGLASKIKGVIG